MSNSSTISSERSSEPAPSSASRPARVLLGLIGWYQRLSSGRPSPCRFYPSCSAYAHEAIEVHGARRGSALALRRLSKCRPLGPHGVDLVPVATKRRSS
jgi:uncharacterized protein